MVFELNRYSVYDNPNVNLYFKCKLKGIVLKDLRTKFAAAIILGNIRVRMKQNILSRPISSKKEIPFGLFPL